MRRRPPAPVLPRSWARHFARPVPECVGFVNTTRANEHRVLEVGRSLALAFSRYEIVTSTKRPLDGGRDHHEARVPAVGAGRGLESQPLLAEGLEPVGVCGCP